MSNKKGSSLGGVITRKKGSNHSIMTPEVHVCQDVIDFIKQQVKKWETYSDLKIAGILTRALANSELIRAKNNKAFNTTVNLLTPGGKHLAIYLQVEAVGTNLVQLKLNPNKPSFKYIPVNPTQGTLQL